MNIGGIPQNRERIYIVGFKDKNIVEKFEFPKPIELRIDLADIINPNDKKESKYYYNKFKHYKLLKEEMKDKNTVYQWRRVYIRKNKSNLCPTLTANMGTGGHNVPLVIDDYDIRKLTPKECLMLQGFPKDFKIPNISDNHIYKQAGNAVSVPVIKRIADNIFKVLNG